LALALAIDKRQAEITRFRDDISRLFERKFTSLESSGAQTRVVREERPDSDLQEESGSAESDETEGSSDEVGTSTKKKKYHSIRDRLLNLPEESDDINELNVNPIARQAATLKPRT
jgi:hypothetical protein